MSNNKVVDFRQVSPLYATRVTKIELLDVFEAKLRYNEPEIVQIGSGVLKMRARQSDAVAAVVYGATL